MCCLQFTMLDNFAFRLVFFLTSNVVTIGTGLAVLRIKDPRLCRESSCFHLRCSSTAGLPSPHRGPRLAGSVCERSDSPLRFQNRPRTRGRAAVNVNGLFERVCAARTRTGLTVLVRCLDSHHVHKEDVQFSGRKTQHFKNKYSLKQCLLG